MCDIRLANSWYWCPQGAGEAFTDDGMGLFDEVLGQRVTQRFIDPVVEEVEHRPGVLNHFPACDNNFGLLGEGIGHTRWHLAAGFSQRRALRAVLDGRVVNLRWVNIDTMKNERAQLGCFVEF